MNPWRKTTQPTKEHRNVTDPQDAVRLLTDQGVMTEVNRRLTDRGYSPLPQAVFDAAAQADE